MNNILGNSARQSAPEVYAEMEHSLFTNAERNDPMNRESQNLCRDVYDLCCNFLENNRLIQAGTDITNTSKVVSMEAFNPDSNLTMIGENELRNLVMQARIPMDQQETAMKAVAVLLAKMKACQGNNELYRNQHFNHGDRKAIDTAKLENNINTIFAPSLFTMAKNIGLPSNEAFGANIDKVLPDIRASMAITLLQFHRGLIDRIIHRRTSASPYVKYVVPYAEVYDMLLSNAKDHMVRNEGEHIIPFLDLYGDPRVVSNQLQPIYPLKVNDTKNVLFKNGVVRFNAEANLFDLSSLPHQLGKSHYNYTDLVSENVVMDNVILKLAKKDASGKETASEEFSINVHNVNGARLQMLPNTEDSGKRGCSFWYTIKLDQNSLMTNGQKSAFLSKCTASDFLRVRMHIYAEINLKYSDVFGMGHAEAEAINIHGAAVAQDVKDILTDLVISLEGYSVDASYSEENLRKSNLAIRYHVRTFDFEISNGRNILVDYSFEEELPEFLMSLVVEATSLGQDHRGIDVIIKELMHVFDVTNEENQDPTFRRRLEKVGFQYVSGQLVRPVVYLNTIDLNNVDTLRSGDFMGDLRSYVEWELLNLVSLFYQNSYYKHQLRPGEKPVFKCFTSAVILENIFSIPHYHNHLNNEEAVDGSTVEYRRVLPNGTILDCVTCTYNYMRDKIVMIPWRESDPEDILNFGHNWDFGTFVAHYNPQLDNAVNKRVFSNSRTMVIPTCPCGIYLDVKNISKITNMFQVTNPTKEALPQPSEKLAEQAALGA